MKKTIFNTIKIVIFLLILGGCIFASTVVLRRKDSDFKYADFLSESKEGHIDVLFIGSSHVINAINPVVLYDDYGYTSYNMGGHGSLLQATYWELRESLEYMTPEWVVVDTYMIEKNVKYLDDREEYEDDDINTSVEQLHLNMDVWPYNDLKVKAIDDLISDEKTKNEFLYDFIVYHNRWQNLTANDFKTLTGTADRNQLFGGEMRYKVEIDPPIHPEATEEDYLTEDTVGCEYLRKIIELCQDKGIGVVVTYYPFAAETGDKAAAVKAGEIAAEYDVPFLNMLELDVVDLYSDLNDHGHLNVTGATKVTDYMGEWLSNTGDLIDHRGDPEYSHWEDNAEKFQAELDDMVLDEDNLYVKLNLLKLDGYSFILYVNEDSGVYHDTAMMHIIDNLSGSGKVSTDNSAYVVIKDGATGKVYDAKGGEILESVPTAMGNLYYRFVEKYYRILSPVGDEDTNYLYDDGHAAEDIQLIIFDSETGEILSHDYYRSYGGNYER